MEQLTINRVIITPEHAKQLLQKNKNNRKIKQPTVKRYANDMANGRWKSDTGEMIKISKEGNVLDGQHRLMAIVMANVPITMHIIYNVSQSVFDVLDTGAVRNAPDVFKVEGVKNNSSIPSIIQTYNLLKNKTKLGSRTKYNSLTNAELLQKYNEKPDFYQSVYHRASSWYKQFSKILPISLIGGLYIYFRDIDEDDAVEFNNQMCGGYSISHESIVLLRNTLIKDKVSTKSISIDTKIAYIIKVWNAYRQDKVIKQLKWIDGEPFPIAT